VALHVDSSDLKCRKQALLLLSFLSRLHSFDLEYIVFLYYYSCYTLPARPFPSRSL
jgi:hypothetical protein